ncbi:MULTISPECIES: helix-turn-helix domain-containing protein [Thermogemmatispora]|jgi:DNA-binding Xre family transcriptional regulator|uniref:helix-turn-helix domain-containing protein n=1 Tax=Thermogemmatispora TaxID=768669 RepID=UPI00069AA25C|nr:MULTISPECIES: helix-turn-helix transcriptional regulator [Thermogemmatispora]MBE3565050.1 helix-turn-helix transcriptional regulator [Thermogemmatispora sp.]GER84077.1 hypothetical protein KTAU_27140 [Thermogemmatispora aurantia]
MYRLRVAELLKERGRTQSWLAREAKVPELLVRKMVREPTTYHPTYVTLDKIARTLKVRVEDLYEWVPDPEDQAS